MRMSLGGVSYLEGTQVDTLLEPAGMVIKPEGRAVRIVMTLEVVHEHIEDFILRTMRRTRIHHGARILLVFLKKRREFNLT